MILRAPVLIFSFLFLFTSYSKAQNQSDEIYYGRLYHLGKVWGYAKYFHPKVAQCNAAWDDILLETLPLVKNAKDKTEFNQILAKMVGSLGEVARPTSPAPMVEILAPNDLNTDWFNDDYLNQSLRDKLIHIRDNFRPRTHCKLKTVFSNGNLNLETETYLVEESIAYPEEAVRVLALFRYWNIIRYFFPYRYQMDQDWDVTLKQFIPTIVGATSEAEYHLSFRELTTYINDSHAFFGSDFFRDWLGNFTAPFQVKYVEGQTVVTKVHSSANEKLAIGDIITSIDGQAIEVVREKLRKYNESSNEPTLQRNINSDLVRGKLGAFEMNITNDEGLQTIRLERKTFTEYQSLYQNNGTAYEIMTAKGGCQVGYIDMELLTKAQVPNMFATFNDLPAIIVDVRNYPQGTLWEMVNFLYTEPVNFSAITNPDIRYPGTFNYRQHSIGQGGEPYKGKLIILFNEETQSQAEFTIMGLEKHPNAIKIGSQTAGADGNISLIDLPGGIRTYFTGLGIYYPDGRETQRIGIVPDIEFYQTIEGIRAGIDEMLAFALDCTLVGVDRPILMDGDGIEVFPNPARHQLTINSEFPSNYRIEVRDILGRYVEEFKVVPNSFDYNLNIGRFQNGVYFFSFIDEKGLFATKKIVKL